MGWNTRVRSSIKSCSLGWPRWKYRCGYVTQQRPWRRGSAPPQRGVWACACCSTSSRDERFSTDRLTVLVCDGRRNSRRNGPPCGTAPLGHSVGGALVDCCCPDRISGCDGDIGEGLGYRTRRRSGAIRRNTDRPRRVFVLLSALSTHRANGYRPDAPRGA
jgi:hypothetical protein